MARTYNNCNCCITVFGAKNIPDVVKSLGQAIVNFRESINKPQDKTINEIEKISNSNEEK